MKSIVAIKRYFESEPHGRKVSMDELKGFSKEERNEVGAMCCAELGEEHEPTE